MKTDEKGHQCHDHSGHKGPEGPAGIPSTHFTERLRDYARRDREARLLDPRIQRDFLWAADEIDQLRDAVQGAVKLFREYAVHHLSKPKRDGTDALNFLAECERKAAVNTEIADKLERILNSQPAQSL